MRDDHVIRTCTKTGCRWPAAASLSYRYATKQAWLLDLADPDPSLYDLCPHHADHLRVPRGWERVDQRTVTEPMVELSHAERSAVHRSARAQTAAGVPGSGGSAASGRSRYAALADDLPRLAREIAADGAGESPMTEPVPEPVAEAEADSGSGSRPVIEPDGRAAIAVGVPTRDLAPMPPSTEPSVVMEGQLSMLPDEAAGGVVLPFDAGRRRPHGADRTPTAPDDEQG
jgi:hypothetical protein